MTQSNQPSPIAPKKRKKWPWILLLVVVCIIGVMFFTASQQIQNSYSQEVVTSRSLETYYSFSGYLVPVSDEVQTAKESYKVRELYVQEGDVVNVGDALLRTTDGTRIYATYEGTIEDLYPVVDDTLQVGSQIAHIVNYDTLEVSIDVDEYDIHAITVGKEGSVYVNALDTTILGTVSDISRSAITEAGISYYQVTMQVPAHDQVFSGMSVEVSVLDQQALSVASLSLSAISYDEYNMPFVYIMGSDQNMQATYIDTGISDGLYMQINSGLSVGDTAYYQVDNLSRFYEMRENMMNMQ